MRRPPLAPHAPRARRAALAVLLALGAAAGAARPAAAQLQARPALDWRTLETERFVFHYPAAMATWTRDVAEQMESVHEAVVRLVGYAPDGRVRVLVEDPSNVSNGFAFPFLDDASIFLWPTPPDPSTVLANNAGWGELLAVHEFAHIAHLARPSRNPRQRLLWRILPVELGPLMRRAPRWLFEGYATFVEGRITGSGRPSSVARAAVLRQWALEGRLPTYAQLDGTAGYLGGSMAYLVGSAYLEWLVERAGEESLPNLWRRMSARQDRGFVAAFTGVWGAPPDELYGRFTAELTGAALAVEDSLAPVLAEGALVQRLALGTGVPAVSPDGERVAVVLRSRDRPSRLVIWPVRDSVDTAAVRRARERARRLDPEDVPAVPGRPAPKRELHTLHPVGGRSHEQPRFMPDGERVLVVRSVPVGDGSERPDLFLWRFRDGTLTRATHGAGVREADPTPDGRAAVGVRCLNGICDVVHVPLGGGEARVLWAGAPRRGFHRPRVSPDGSTVLVSVHEDARWRLALLPLDGGAPRDVPVPDDASRYAADWLSASEIVATSERGGVAHLERIALAGREPRALTRTTGGHLLGDVAPDGGVWFLALHARGHDVRRVAADSLAPPARAGIVATLPFVAPPTPPAGVTLPRAPLPADRPYGLGPRLHAVLPGALLAPEGEAAILALTGTDPIGRLTWVLQGVLGERAAWRGGSLAAELRVLPVSLRGELFGLRQLPSAQREGAIARASVGTALDAEQHGATLSAAMGRDWATRAASARAGVSVARLSAAGDAAFDDATRGLAFARGTASARWSRDRTGLTLTLAGGATTGSTGGATWTRTTASADLAVGAFGLRARGSATLGAVSDDAPPFERFVVGGVLPPLAEVAVLEQRWSVPALPVGVSAGTRLLSWRAETDLFGVTPYFQRVSAGDAFGARQRIVGVERAFLTPSGAFIGLPRGRLLAGVAQSLDEPFRSRTRAYLRVTIEP